MQALTIIPNYFREKIAYFLSLILRKIKKPSLTLLIKFSYIINLLIKISKIFKPDQPLSLINNLQLPQIKRAFENLDYVTLQRLYAPGEMNGSEIFYCMQTHGNALHLLCVQSSPLVKETFYIFPPFYEKGEMDYLYTPEQFKGIILLLVAKGISIDSRDSLYSQNVLATAIGFDNTPAALALIDYISTQNILYQIYLLNDCSKGTFSATPLILAIQKSNIIVFNHLLETKLINVNLPDKHGLTPLHWAVIMGLPEMVQKLLQENAQVIPANNGKKPLDYLDIGTKDFLPQLSVATEEKPAYYIPHSTQEPAFRAILSHFNEDVMGFLRIRANKMKLNKDAILALFNASLPVVSLTYIPAMEAKSPGMTTSLTSKSLASTQSLLQKVTV